MECDGSGYPFLVKFTPYPSIVVDGLNDVDDRGDQYKRRLCAVINELSDPHGIAGIIDDVVGIDGSDKFVRYVRIQGRATLESLDDFEYCSHIVRTYCIKRLVPG